MLKRQVGLARPGEPLQIPLPHDFQGQQSHSKAGEIVVSTDLAPLTLDEIEVVQRYVASLPYPQRLKFGTVLLDAADPLKQATHEELDRLERAVGLSNTRFAVGGGERQVVERALLIREASVNDDEILAAVDRELVAR